MSEISWPDRAHRLLGELMPVSVIVAGQGATEVAAALRTAGTEAVVVADGAPEPCDLALLLSGSRADDPAMRDLAAKLTAITDRILLVPETDRGTDGGLAEATAWFELFAERGFQPVLEYDAAFLGAGAFLVDRNAVAAEAELADFTERLGTSAAPALPAAAPLPDPELAELRRQLAARSGELELLGAELADARAQAEAWAPLRRWVEACARAGRKPTKPSRLRRWLWRRTRRGRKLMDAEDIRHSELFDPAWYIASHPDLAEVGGDPVLHYLRHAATADPGPWFDTQAYLRDHPELDPVATNPLLHAIRRSR